MEQRKASNTAVLTATLRAAHQLIDDDPRIVDDPIAVGLLEDASREHITARRAALLSPALMVPRAAVLLRSRYTEDLLAQAVEHGVGQFVILAQLGRLER
jgi:O-methyltransferase involved in polyketide biosynthesis